MKKKILFITVVTIFGCLFYFNATKKTEVELLREKHTSFLKNNPIKKFEKLTRKERFELGLTPNKYLERMWVLTANPALGKPTPEKLSALYEDLKLNRNLQRVPGDGTDNAWVERGPNNVGGRTRAIFFDPNDATNETVYAGGVSGGLWKNTNISNASSVWTRVEDLDNFAISCYAIDPNNSNIWYVGTGEAYTSSDAVGNGIYKTIDGGANWTRVLNSSGATDTSNATQYLVPGIHFITDIIVRDKDGSSATTNDSEVFASVASGFYSDGGSSLRTFLGIRTFGIYKSTDNGSSWNWISPNNPNIPGETAGTLGALYASNDFEIGADNTLWLATTRSIFGNGGGTILKSTDGSTFSVAHTIADGVRTELAVSKTNANKLYALAQVSGGNPTFVKTTDGFTTSVTPDLPKDPDGSVTDDDFTRGQAGYDLVIEVDPNNDDILYVGGINAHRSGVNDPGGNPTWKTITYWASFWSPTTPGSEVHADHHAIVFKPSNSNQGIFGTDGGVSYTTDFSDDTEASNAPSAQNRNNGFNVTQFYTLGVAPKAAFPGAGDYFLAGAQDNGTQLFENASAGQVSTTDVSGGDGAYSFFDQDGTDKYYITNYVYNQIITCYDYTTNTTTTVDSDGDSDENGDFINVEELDSQLNVLYSNYSSGSNFIIRRYAGLPTGPITSTDMTNALLTGSPTAMKVSPRSSDFLIGTENGRLLKVTGITALETWSDITGSGFVGSISDVEYGATDNDIFVTFHNYGVQSVWYSNDGGTSWSSKEGDLPDLPVKAILQNPLNTKEVIIGTDLGVWKTTDFSVGSPAWTQSYNGMSSVKVTDLDLRDDNMVFAATYGRGVFSGSFTAATASINDILAGNKVFSVYPTVSKGDFTLQAKSSLGKTQMNIFNIGGKQVYSKQIDFSSNEKQEVSVNLNSGVYIVNLLDENNKKSSSKIVIE